MKGKEIDQICSPLYGRHLRTLACYISFIGVCTTIATGCEDSRLDNENSITVLEATETKIFEEQLAKSDRRFVDLLVEIHNGENETTEMSILFSLFSLETSANRLYNASEYTALSKDACASDAMLLPGGSATCRVVFEVPVQEEIISNRDYNCHFNEGRTDNCNSRKSGE